MKTARISLYSFGCNVWLRVALLLGIVGLALVAWAGGNGRPVSEDWYAYDSNGNVILLTDEAAKPTARYQYDAFGKTTTAEGPAAETTCYRFSTKPIESDSGLAFYGYRYYSPELGRWTSCDPMGERSGPNTVSFVRNRPTMDGDYLGLAGISVSRINSEGTENHVWNWVLGSSADPNISAHGSAALAHTVGDARVEVFGGEVNVPGQGRKTWEQETLLTGLVSVSSDGCIETTLQPGGGYHSYQGETDYYSMSWTFSVGKSGGDCGECPKILTAMLALEAWVPTVSKSWWVKVTWTVSP